MKEKTTALQKVREYHRMSREEVHKLSGVSTNPLFCAEHGTQSLAISTLDRLAKLYHCSVDSLLRDDADAAMAEAQGERLVPVQPLLRCRGPAPRPPGRSAGLEKCRRSRHMSLRTLAELTGMDCLTLSRMEKYGLPAGSRAVNLKRLCWVTGLRVEELFAACDADEMEDGDRGRDEAKSRYTTNVVDNYRVAHNLTYRQLAARMGYSHQNAHKACGFRMASSKHVERLARYEGISTSEFLIRYAAPASKTE